MIYNRRGLKEVKSIYEVVQYLGRGRNSLVYLIKENFTYRVMKIIPFQDEKEIRGYLAGIDLQNNLSYACIPKIYEIQKYENRLIVFEEYIDGESLYQYVENKGSLSYQDILHLGLELIQIIRYLHHQKTPIIHLDIHPRNLIVKEKQIFLIDFGNAKEQGKALNGYGMRGYIAPEIYLGNTADQRMDIYAFASTLLYASTGQNPSDIMEYPNVWEYKFIRLMQDCLADIMEREVSAKEVEQRLLCIKKEEERDRAQIIRRNKIFYKTLRIGIIGSCRHVGVSFFVIALAHFLKKYANCRPVVAQEHISSDMTAIKKLKTFRRFKDGEAFTMAGILYIPYHKESNIEDYDIIISDYGGEYEYKYEEFIQSDICIVVCDTSVWRYEALKSILGSEIYRKKRQTFVSVFGDQQTAKKLERKYKISILKIPYSDSAFHIDYDMYIFLKNLCVLLDII